MPKNKNDSKKENSNKPSVKKTNTTTAAANSNKTDKHSTTTPKEQNKKKKKTSKKASASSSRNRTSGSASLAAAGVISDDDDFDYDYWEEPTNLPEWMEEIRSETRRFNKYLKLETTSISRRSINDFCKFLQFYICHVNSNSEEHSIVAKDAFVWLSTFITDSDTARTWCDAVYVIIESDVEFTNDEIFGGAEVRDAFINIAKSVLLKDEDDRPLWKPDSCSEEDSEEDVPNSDDDNYEDDGYDMMEVCWFDPSHYVGYFDSIDVVGSWCQAAARCVQNDPNNREVFGTTEMRDVIISLYELVTPMTAFEWFSLVRSLTKKNEENQTLFGVVEMRDLLLKISENIEGSTDKVYVLEILYNIFAADDKDVNIMFAIEKFEQLVLDVSDKVTNSTSAYHWCKVVDTILRTNPKRLYDDDKVTALAVLNVATMNQSGSIHTPESLCSTLVLIRGLLTVNDGAFFNDYFPQICRVVKIFKHFLSDPVFIKKLLVVFDEAFEFLDERMDFRAYGFDDAHENDDDDAGNKITGKQYINNDYIGSSKQLIRDIEILLKTTL